MHKKPASILLIGSLCFFQSTAQAHNVWVKPSGNALEASDQQLFSVDVSRSETPFIAAYNHGVKNLSVLAPSGNQASYSAAFSGATKESFEVKLAEHGTYLLQTAPTTVYLSTYKNKAGEEQRGVFAKDELDKIPGGAKLLDTVEMKIISTSYVSLGKDSTISSKLYNNGFALVPLTHPNKVKVGETFKVQALLNGKPSESDSISVINNNQYFKQTLIFKPTKLENGIYEVTFSNPGQYLVSAAANVAIDNKTKADSRTYSTNISLRVLDL